MRLDRLLSQAGHGTRSEVRALLRAGRVFVDGAQVKDAGFQLDTPSAQILLDGKPVAFRQAMHLMLNKPTGVLTAARDARKPTVLSLLPEACIRQGCMPVGRLDMDTEGLLLLTTDGVLAHRLLSPRRHVEKEYIAEVEGMLDADDVRAFAEGIALSDFVAMPARLILLPGGRAGRVIVHEGKYHQVKRMFGARGKSVVRLRRVAFAGLPLDEALAPGAYRELTDEEVRRLYAAAGGASDA